MPETHQPFISSPSTPILRREDRHAVDTLHRCLFHLVVLHDSVTVTTGGQQTEPPNSVGSLQQESGARLHNKQAETIVG